MNGKAVIIGPAGTPYADCPLLFHIKLPSDYPFRSPSVTFMTSDGVTRFHPNLYVTGKVCLSILGTWKGPPWSAAMTLGKMLLTIQSLLEANPIVNEPSYEDLTLQDPKAKSYAELVEARLVDLSFRDLLRLKRGDCPPAWKEMKEMMEGLCDGLLQNLYKRILIHTEEKVYSGVLYSMSGSTYWGHLREMGEKEGLNVSH